MAKVFEFKSNGKFIVIVDDYSVKVQPKGIMNFMTLGGSKGEKSIPISSISAIQFKKPSITTGYIQFAYAGSIETKAGTLSAAADENSITFHKKDLAKAEELVALIESKRQNPIAQVSAADELKKFKELLDEGILTKEEFEAKKKQLLGI
ncbi:DUF4429 domain-containing protein [Lysinibacillus sp. SGAir0095]|uniref:DUF4429 domain-containing protein n=1 Tax=Lysinibacillus sp. SGAir0095 TaxID=2070463 RepID=UPI0010CD3199|nr:DUF4429 domain-containing protein [Lysinibacillus sp. SGAir0095]QCR33100.1 hypothetical protein C1N55_13330 [Lysinibacillus sp. SGAir0095]